VGALAKILVGTGIAGGAGVALWLSLRSASAANDSQSLDGALNMAKHVLNGGSWVETSPDELASGAGATLEEYSLASAMQSEDPSAAGSVAVGFVVVNHCNSLKKGIAAVLTTDMRAGVANPGNGHFGSEKTGGRYCSTAKPPKPSMLASAKAILAGDIEDPTGGALFWDGPAAQDAAHERDPVNYTEDWPARKAKLEGRGWTMVVLPGIPERQTVFWRLGPAKGRAVAAQSGAGHF
jgi:hypothetical protein